MKILALYSVIVCLTASAASGQNQSDIEFLRARADAQERKIAQLEEELNHLKAQLAQKSATSVASKLEQASGESNKDAISGSIYVVKQGDILSRIAKDHNTSVARILEENALENDRIYVGQKLNIGKANTGKVAAPVAPRAEAAASPTAVGEHQVQRGETFFSIARIHDVSVASLQAANPAVVPTRLSVGQILKIDGNAKAVSPSLKKSADTAPQKSSAGLASSNARDTAPQTKSATKNTASKVSQRDPEPAIRTITVDQQITYGQFASKHGASTTQLNELNGLSLSKNTTLAKGSELYVPKF